MAHGPNSKPHDHMGVSIVYCPESECWGWMWFHEGLSEEPLASNGGFKNILDCYQDAARWSMMDAPMEITEVTCQIIGRA